MSVLVILLLLISSGWKAIDHCLRRYGFQTSIELKPITWGMVKRPSPAFRGD